MNRDDYFTMIHKGLRHALFEVNVQAGRTDFGDPAAVSDLRSAWDDFCMALGGHSEHEDQHMFPMVSRRVPEGAKDLYEDHVRIHGLERAITDQLDRIAAEPDAAQRRMLGLECYRAMQRFTAASLVHFDVEEVELMPRIWALCDDEEIARTRAAFMAAIPPAEMRYGVAHMLESVDPTERRMLEERMPAA